MKQGQRRQLGLVLLLVVGLGPVSLGAEAGPAEQITPTPQSSPPARTRLDLNLKVPKYNPAERSINVDQQRFQNEFRRREVCGYGAGGPITPPSTLNSLSLGEIKPIGLGIGGAINVLNGRRYCD
ncbi:hypothetical protein [Anthocerotibacter panamensis]|uniref:hypothetical protein n=1 Tax=Anthocerotibacter panamensis TaxID=2857077 RepID=UPI001C402006|nr:hypothetical protein [Anthocerotibacter panamensis]